MIDKVADMHRAWTVLALYVVVDAVQYYGQNTVLCL